MFLSLLLLPVPVTKIKIKIKKKKKVIDFQCSDCGGRGGGSGIRVINGNGKKYTINK